MLVDELRISVATGTWPRAANDYPQAIISAGDGGTHPPMFKNRR